MADEKNTTVLQDGQLAIATVAQTGELITGPSAIDTTALVQTVDGPQLCVKTVSVGGGGGGGGTTDYTDLENKPSINSVTLTGNKTGADLGLLSNTATGQDSLTLLGTPAPYANNINIGKNSAVGNNISNDVIIGNESKAYSAASVIIGYGAKNGSNGENVAIGAYADAEKYETIAIGSGMSSSVCAKTNAHYTIQLGIGVNNTEATFQVWDYTLLDKNTGKIPAARLSAKNAYFNFEDSNSYIISANDCPASYSSLEITVKCTGAINKKSTSNNQIFIGTPDDSACFFIQKSSAGGHLAVWSGSETASTVALYDYQTTFWLKLVADGAGAGHLYYLPDNNYTLATLPAITSWTDAVTFTGFSLGGKKVTVSQPAQHCAYNTTFYEAKVVADNTTVLDLQDASTFQVLGAVRKTQWFE